MARVDEIRADEKGVCPHCGTTVRFLWCEQQYSPGVYAGGPSELILGDGSKSGHSYASNVAISFARCPDCNRSTIVISSAAGVYLAWPRSIARGAVHASVPGDLVKDYEEAILVLSVSPNASAALSRRCLQTLLVKQGAKKRNLVDQINELKPSLPSYIQEFVDSIRQVGNLAAHAKEHSVSAEIVDVEPHEGEWLIELLAVLFDHYYAKPAQARVTQEALNHKLSTARSLSK